MQIACILVVPLQCIKVHIGRIVELNLQESSEMLSPKPRLSTILENCSRPDPALKTPVSLRFRGRYRTIPGVSRGVAYTQLQQRDALARGRPYTCLTDHNVHTYYIQVSCAPHCCDTPISGNIHINMLQDGVLYFLVVVLMLQISPTYCHHRCFKLATVHPC